MPEQLTTLPHDFTFLDEDRGQVTLVGSARLDSKLGVVVLKPDSNGDYPTTGDHYVISSQLNPGAVRSWAGFQANIAHINDGISQLTGDGFRLHDGIDQWYWDGSTWERSNTLWSTEADIALNINTFTTSSKAIRIVIRLTTTDNTQTPTLYWVRIAWIGKVYPIEDILYRTLVPALRLVRTQTDFVIKVAFPGGATVDVGTAVKTAETPFNVVDVDGVYNNNVDPDHNNNLLDTYNSTTKIATLSSAVPVGQYMFLRLVCSPQVSVEATGVDYREVEKAPALQLTDIEAVDSQPLAASEGIARKADGSLIRIHPPYRINLRFTMIALAPGGVDLTRMLQALVEFMEQNPTITSKATGEQHRLWMVNEFSNTTHPSGNNLHTSQATINILDILMFAKPATTETAVQAANFRF